MLQGIAKLVIRWPRRILLVAGLLLVAAAVFGVRAPAQLKLGGFTSPNAPSQIAADRLQSGFGGSPSLVLLVQARSATVDSPQVRAAGLELASRVAHSGDVTAVESYWSSLSPQLRSKDGTQALVLASLAGGDSQRYKAAKAIEQAVDVAPSRSGSVTVLAGGALGAGNAISSQISKDLAMGEGIAIPLTVILLILAFGSVVAALLPVLIGVISIFITLFVLWVLSTITDVSVYAINLTTALGLGLGIDYALLLVNRYREELKDGTEPAEAVRRSVIRAGRTIVYSAATVAAALAALLLFPVYFLRSFAYAGISVVALSVAAAVIVLPAMLTVLGTRVNSLALPWRRQRPPQTESPFWRRSANRVMDRPFAYALPVVALLLVAGVPFLRVHFGTPDDRVLPTSSTARQVGDALRTSFSSDASEGLDAVTSSRVGPLEASTYSMELSALPGVQVVDGPAGTWIRGVQVAAAGPQTARYQSAVSSWFSAVTDLDPLGTPAARLVGEARALPPPPGTTVAIGGPAASLVDQKHDLGSRLPLAILVMCLTTFVLLFLFTGSVVLPLKALLLNALTLTAVFGVMVWVFQDGHASGLLGFTPTPTSTTMPILLFCIAFGLSMDYEVFILSRIKELHDAGAPNREAVTGGLARTGRIVTTAAGILAVTFLAFGLSQVEFIKLFGLGTALAILVDATLVRGVLVPAFMQVAGDLNWWAPRSMRRLHRRIALTEAG